MKNPKRVERKLHRRIMLSGIRAGINRRRSYRQLLGMLRHGGLVYTFNNTVPIKNIMDFMGEDSKIIETTVSFSIPIPMI